MNRNILNTDNEITVYTLRNISSTSESLKKILQENNLKNVNIKNVTFNTIIEELQNNDIIAYDSYVILQKPITFFIGQYFEYNLQMLFVLVILSIAIQTCVYNKLACGYLGINLAEKSYFDFELEPTYIYIICFVNILVAGYLTYKGIKMLLK